jgi:hypothetical protein
MASYEEKVNAAFEESRGRGGAPRHQPRRRLDAGFFR